jgi:hypothetical protein
MAQKVTGIYTDLRIESAAFIRDLTKASRAVASHTSSMQKSLRSLDRGFASAAAQAKGFLVGFASVAAVRQLAMLGKEAIDGADAIAKQSRAIGIAGEELQKLRYAADIAGVELGQFDTAIGLFVKNLGAAKAGTGNLFNVLKQGNPELLKAITSTENVSDALKIYLRGLEQTTGAAERARIGAAGFGKQWLAAAKLIGEGSTAFEASIKRAEELGFVLGGSTLAAAERLQDQMTDLREAASLGFQRGFIDGFIGSLDASDEALKEINKGFEEFGRITAAAFAKASSYAGNFGKQLRTLSLYIEAVKLTKGKGREGLDLIVGGFDVSQQDNIIAFIKKYGDVSRDLSKASDAATSSVSKTTASIVKLGAGADSFDDLNEKQEEFVLGLQQSAAQNDVLREALSRGSAAFQAAKDQIDATNKVMAQGIDVTTEFGKAQVALALGVIQSSRALDDASKATEAQTEFSDGLKRTIDDNAALAGAVGQGASAFQETKDRIEATNDAMDQGIDVTTAYGREMVALGVAARQSAQQLEDVQASVAEGIETLNSIASSAGDSIASTFADAIVEGKKFQDVINDLLNDLAKMALNAAFKMLLGNVIGNFGVPGGQAGSGLLGAAFHGGGIVGSEGKSRAVPASLLASAPRFHGGMMPGEYPAILQKGEGVFTPAQMKAMGGGGNVNINVVNRSGSDVSASGRRDGQGDLDIEVVIDQVMSRKLIQPGSGSNRAMKQGFGVEPVGIRR